jgi:hypothetical protein
LNGEDWAGGPNIFLVAASVSRFIVTNSASKGSTQVTVTFRYRGIMMMMVMMMMMMMIQIK